MIYGPTLYLKVGVKNSFYGNASDVEESRRLKINIVHASLRRRMMADMIQITPLFHIRRKEIKSVEYMRSETLNHTFMKIFSDIKVYELQGEDAQRAFKKLQREGVIEKDGQDMNFEVSDERDYKTEYWEAQAHIDSLEGKK